MQLTLSLIGNYLSVLAVCGIFTIGSFYEEDETSDARTVIIALIVSEVIGAPLMIMPYIFRYDSFLPNLAHCNYTEFIL